MKAYELIEQVVHNLNYLREDCMVDEDIQMIDEDVANLTKLAKDLKQLTDTEY